jgi:hypothetical protein
MRTLILVFFSLAFIIAGFFAYLATQTGAPVAGSGPSPAVTLGTGPATRDGKLGNIGAGTGAWATRYDRDTGQPLVRFRAEEYQPQPDGRVLVVRPQVEFYLGAQRKKVCRVEGATGWVNVRGDAPRIASNLKTLGPTQTPSRGDMENVSIRYFESHEDMVAGNPEVMLDLQRMSFDLETFRLSTESYIDAQGRRIEAENVPVQVRGKGFDFDGYGLEVRWDEFDQKLAQVRVFRGERLLIKDPGQMQLPGKAKPATRAAEGERAFDPGLDEALLAATGRAASAPKASTRRATGDVYRATFQRNVRIVQGEVELARTPQMHADFLSPNSSLVTKSEPATRRSAPAGGRTPQPPVPAENDAAPAPKPTEPVIITWQGEFTIYPLVDATPLPRSSHDAVVRMSGPGTIVTSSGSRAECDEAVYQAEAKAATLRGAPGRPAKLIDARGAIILSPSIEYSASEGWAVLTGASSAQLPTQQTGKPETMQASWTKVCTLRFTQGPRSVIEQAELSGDVKVQHPQVPKFAAQKLSLQFDPRRMPSTRRSHELDSTSLNLRRLEAEGNVDAVLADAAGATRSIQCARLRVDAENGADGKLYPTRLEAHGKVNATDKDQSVRAENIVASLVPGLGDAKRPQLAGLRDLQADGDVLVTAADGGKLQAEKVRVTSSGESDKIIRLEAKPGEMAMLAKSGRALWGPLIEADSAKNTAAITGAGAMRLSNPASPERPAMPVDINWNRSAFVDGVANKARIDGKVTVSFLASDGSTNTAWGEQVDMELAPVPDAKPRAGEVTFLADRFVKRIDLRPADGQEVQIQSLLPAADGSLIRQLNLLGPLLTCELTALGLERVTVPAGKEKPGRLLYLDLTPANRSPTPVRSNLESKGLHGATAFAWRDKLVYDRAKSMIEMTGDVLVRHEPANRVADSFELTGDKVTALLVEQRDVAGRVPAAPKPRPEAQTPTLALKRIVIEGRPLSFTRQDFEFTAPRVEFEPITQLAIARGTPQMPVRVQRGPSRGDFGEAEFNTESQMVRLRDAGITGRK